MCYFALTSQNTLAYFCWKQATMMISNLSICPESVELLQLIQTSSDRPVDIAIQLVLGTITALKTVHYNH